MEATIAYRAQGIRVFGFLGFAGLRVLGFSGFWGFGFRLLGLGAAS